MPHGVAEFLLIAKAFGVEFHSASCVAHLQEQIALIFQRIDEVDQCLACFFGTTFTFIEHCGVEFGGVLIVCEDIHLVGSIFVDAGGCFHSQQQHGREACIVAFHQSLENFLCFGEFLHGAAIVVGEIVHDGEIIEQCSENGEEIFVALIVDFHHHVECIFCRPQRQYVVVAMNENTHSHQPEPTVVQGRELVDFFVEHSVVDVGGGFCFPIVEHQVAHPPNGDIVLLLGAHLARVGFFARHFAQCASYFDIGLQRRGRHFYA